MVDKLCYAHGLSCVLRCTLVAELDCNFILTELGVFHIVS